MGALGHGHDVVVIGSGIAGVSAAIEAARTGARVVLASLGATFSGSSFYGGTWGLGLVGPEDEGDADDFAQTIMQVGCNQADPALVRQLVEGVDPAIRWLEDMGVSLRQPTDASQRAYIPCFDHKTRGWHGLVRESLRSAWERELARLGVTRLPMTELVDLEEHDGRIVSATLHDHARGQTLRICCGAVVLATGGLAGLYERRLTADDTCGSAHGIALVHGCSLVNAEFLQMMPGIVSPVRGVVVNEKALRYSTLPFAAEVLDERSGYGPFTSRLASCAVDLAIAAAGPSGMPLSHRLPSEAPELVADYFAWLQDAFGIRAEDEVRIALYAHASNGGIRIGPDTACVGGPAGLFACGECAGGMHGADRIGGLASASALVFGRRAGAEAARVAGCGKRPAAEVLTASSAHPGDAPAPLEELRHTMSEHAMVGRTERGLNAALQTVDALAQRLQEGSSTADSTRLRHQLAAAAAMLTAMRDRKESCGSHHRADES